MSNEQNLVRDGLVREVEAALRDVEELIGRLTPEQMVLPGASGEWSFKDTLAHLAEWNRWNFAQIRSAFEGTEPVLDGHRPSYPPAFDDILPPDERNAMIAQAATQRGPREVKADFDAVIGGFLDWMRTRSGADMNEILGLDIAGAQSSPPASRLIRRAKDIPGLINMMPMSQMLFDSNPDVGSISHWYYHLVEVREFIERVESGRV